MNCAEFCFFFVHQLLCPEVHETKSTRSIDCSAVSGVQKEGIFHGIFALFIIASCQVSALDLPNQHSYFFKKSFSHYCTDLLCDDHSSLPVCIILTVAFSLATCNDWVKNSKLIWNSNYFRKTWKLTPRAQVSYRAWSIDHAKQNKNTQTRVFDLI